MLAERILMIQCWHLIKLGGLEGDRISPTIQSVPCASNSVYRQQCRGLNTQSYFFTGGVFHCRIHGRDDARSCDAQLPRFWLDISNLIDVSAALVALAEIV